MLEKIVEETVAKKEMFCVVKRWMDTLEQQELDVLHKALNDHGIHVTWRVVSKYTYRGSESAFYRHFKGMCKCFQN